MYEDEHKRNPWLLSVGAKPNARMRLFCFPYGGGTAHIYHSWPNQLPAWVDVCAVQPPGRANRLQESPFTIMDDLISAATESLKTCLGIPFAFFGHSIGALASFELARRFRQDYGIEPSLLIVSGCRAPQIPYSGPLFYGLPDAQFLAEIERVGGTPKELLEHAELMQLMMPLLRADFALDQTYAYAEAPQLSCPIVVFGGLEDEIVSRESLEGWRRQTANTFSAFSFPGGHFFINTAREQLLDAISLSLNSIRLP